MTSINAIEKVIDGFRISIGMTSLNVIEKVIDERKIVDFSIKEKAVRNKKNCCKRRK